MPADSVDEVNSEEMDWNECCCCCSSAPVRSEKDSNEEELVEKERADLLLAVFRWTKASGINFMLRELRCYYCNRK
jgi:hypothetical protein|tara:strand:- start:106 stop:333 length:228 start_codon:yes stop_codon:yes gene_type:complete